jgi:hypothetical protein
MAIRARRGSTRCSQCERLVTGSPYTPSGGPLRDNFYCSFECAHTAGNRNNCKPGCGCTGFERMCNENRMLRTSMQVMDSIIENHDLLDEHFEWSGAVGAHVFNPWHEPEEESDPEKALHAQVATLRAEVAALRAERNELESLRVITSMAAATLDHGAIVRDVERARMALEDSQGLR